MGVVGLCQKVKGSKIDMLHLHAIYLTKFKKSVKKDNEENKKEEKKHV